MIRPAFRAAVTTGGSAMAGMMLSLLANKIVSVVLGPAGVGLYALMLQVHTTASSFSTFGGGGIAVVQGLASREGVARTRFVSTAGWMFTAGLCLAVLALIGLAPVIQRLLSDAGQYLTIPVLRSLAVPVALGTVAVFWGSILNGHREIGALAVIRVLGNLTTAALIYPATLLVRAGSAVGFVAVLAFSMAVQMVVAGWKVKRRGYLREVRWTPALALDGRAARQFLSFAGALLLVGLASQVGMLLLNAQVLRSFGLAGSGLFSAAWSLSMSHVTLILLSFNTFFLPTLAGAKSADEGSIAITAVLQLATMAAVPLIVTVIVLKPLAIRLLFSPEFLDALPIIRWMLIGDYLKVTAWVFATPVTARGDMRIFIIAELAWYVALLLGGMLLMRALGSPEGIGIMFAVSYSVYLLYHVHYVRTRWQYHLARRDVVVWLAGLVLLLIASAMHWAGQRVRPLDATLWILAGLTFSWIALGRVRRAQVIRLVRNRVHARR